MSFQGLFDGLDFSGQTGLVSASTAPYHPAGRQARHRSGHGTGYCGVTDAHFSDAKQVTIIPDGQFSQLDSDFYRGNGLIARHGCLMAKIASPVSDVAANQFRHFLDLPG